jgi:hypothetical protein
MKKFAIATCAAHTLATSGVGAQQITGTVDSPCCPPQRQRLGCSSVPLQQRVCESAIPAPARAGEAGRAAGAGGGGRQAGPPPLRSGMPSPRRCSTTCTSSG